MEAALAAVGHKRQSLKAARLKVLSSESRAGSSRNKPRLSRLAWRHVGSPISLHVDSCGTRIPVSTGGQELVGQAVSPANGLQAAFGG